MELKHLHFFKRAAELEHITKAAEELSISQSFLSRTLAELQDELGVDLFDRVGRGIALNPCGKAFYSRAEKILNDIADAKKEVWDIHCAQESQINVVTNVGLYMPKLFKAISEIKPGISISQLSAKRRSMIKMLKSGESDFAICCPPLLEEAELETEILFFERGVIIYPEGHWLENRDEILLEEIKDETLISVAVGFGTRDALEEYFKMKNTHPRIALETGDTSSLFNYVALGLGIAALPYSIVLDHPVFQNRWVSVVDESGALGSRLSISWRKTLYMSETAKMFIGKAKEYFSEINGRSEPKGRE